MKKLTYEEYRQILERYPEYWEKPKKVEKVNNKHDKIFKTILENKEEAANFINQALKLTKNIKPEEIEKYSSSFITKNFEAQESDIIYKIKGKKVFMIIEHQTKIDFSMSYRILNYQIEGSGLGTIENCLKLSDEQMKNKEKITLEDNTQTDIISLLNAEEKKYKEDTENENGGYPIFK